MNPPLGRNTDQFKLVSVTDKEYKALQDMLQSYREFEEEKYNYPDTETLFTIAQRRLFQRFNIVSIKEESNA